MSSICSYEVKRRPQLTHSRGRLMVAPSRLSRESTTRSRFSEQKGHLMAAGGLVRTRSGKGRKSPTPSLLGVQGDVEAQQQLLEISRVLDLDRQVVAPVDHPGVIRLGPG